MEYLKDTLNEKEFLEKVFESSKSKDSLSGATTALNNFGYFVDDEFGKTREQVLSDLMAEYKKNRDSKKPLILLSQFKTWLGKDHKNIEIKIGRSSTLKKKKVSAASKKAYLSHIKKWLRLCGNIKIDNDDFRDLVAVKISELEDETEADPVTREELKEILTWVKDPLRRAKFLFMKSTAARHMESLRIKKSDIDFTVNPPKVTFRKSIVKGKTYQRFAYLDSESASAVRNISKNLDDNDFVFRDKRDFDKEEQEIRSNESTFWNRLMDKIAEKTDFNEINKRAENGRLIKRIHSIRSFAMKCIEKGNSSGELGDSYGGHKKFVGKYLDKTEKERIEIFQKAAPHMALFSEIVTVDNEELKEKYEQKFLKQEEELHYVRGMLEFVLQQNGIKFEIKDKIQA